MTMSMKPLKPGIQQQTSPSVLCDDTGSLVVPTVVPPRTEFPTGPQEVIEEPTFTSVSGKAAPAKHIRHSEDYFNSESVQQPLPGDSTIATADHTGTPSVPSASARQDIRQLDRPNVARTWQSERPKPGPRRSTLTAAFKRRSTAQPNNDNYYNNANGSLPFYEPSHDEESSSSSSSDDEADRKRSKKQAKNAYNGTDDRSRKHLQREREYSKINVGNDHYKTKGRVSKRDGRLNISVNETSNHGYIAKALGHSMKNHLDASHGHGKDSMLREMAPAETHENTRDRDFARSESGDAASIASSIHRSVKRPKLNIVIMVIGSRGDIQPFMQIGRVLKRYGHRVRIATHPAFKDFVEQDVGLEFFSIGGNPSELMAFMVKNPGLIPTMETVRQGEIARRRSQMAEMFEGFWRACVNITDNEKDKQNMRLRKLRRK